MKVNEKNLVAIASASHLVVDKEGWLNKRGEVNKGFQKRWFVLKGNLLFYYEKKTDREPVGVLVIEGCTVELSADDEPYSFSITFHGPGDRTYTLSAEDQDTMESWMKAISCASYDYMKVMVTELQKQVDELTELEKMKRQGLISKPASSNGAPPPAVPSRQRHNPFNLTERAENSATLMASKHVTKKLTFTDIHTEYGVRIIQARERWIKNQKLAAPKSLTEEVLITL